MPKERKKGSQNKHFLYANVLICLSGNNVFLTFQPSIKPICDLDCYSIQNSAKKRCLISIYFFILETWSVGQSVSLKVWCGSPDTDRTRREDFVRFGQAPDTVMDKCSVQVQYNCSAACRIAVEIVISTPTRTGVIVYRRSWTNHKRFGKPRSRKVPLVFRREVSVSDVVLRAWMLHLDQEELGENHAEGYDRSLVRTSTFVMTLPASQRPACPQTGSVSWGAWLMWQLTEDTVRKCPHESGGNQSECLETFKRKVHK